MHLPSRSLSPQFAQAFLTRHSQHHGFPPFPISFFPPSNFVASSSSSSPSTLTTMIRTAITPRFLCTTLGQLRATPLRSFCLSPPHYTFHRPIRCFSTTQLRSSVTQPTDAETERHQAAVGEEQAAQDLGMKQPRMRHWPKDDKPLRDMNSEGKEGENPLLLLLSCYFPAVFGALADFFRPATKYA